MTTVVVVVVVTQRCRSSTGHMQINQPSGLKKIATVRSHATASNRSAAVALRVHAHGAWNGWRLTQYGYEPAVLLRHKITPVPSAIHCGGWCRDIHRRSPSPWPLSPACSPQPSLRRLGLFVRHGPDADRRSLPPAFRRSLAAGAVAAAARARSRYPPPPRALHRYGTVGSYGTCVRP